MQEIQMNGESRDLTQDNIEKLKEIFPEVFNENKIDFDKLQVILGENIDTEDEKYRFTWNGKMDSIRLSQSPSLGTLRPCKEDSKDWDNTQNLYIEGDNLEVLKLLQNSYLNKIKMIYIDPPYNTGNDFVYKDDYTDSIENYKKQTGLIDCEGNATTTNSDACGRYHTNWLNMMYPRLRLGYNLLADDGFICISINDVELHNLKKICDEIFGIDNFINIVTIKSATTASFRAINACPVNVAEYLLIYSKTKNAPINPVYQAVDYSEDYSHIITNFDEKSESWILQSLDDLVHKNNNVNTWQEYRNLKGDDWKNIRYKEKREIAFKEKHRVVSLNTMQKPSNEVQNVVDLSKNDRGKVFRIDRENASPIYVYNGRTLAFFEKKFKEIDGKLLPAEIITNVWTDISYLSLGKEGDVNYANGKKPIALINRLCELYTNKNDTILDFFAGSSSTAHTIMELNKRSKSTRKFIMIQLPENLDISLKETTNQSTKKNLKNSIEFLDSINKPHILTELGKERIRRAGNKIYNEINTNNQLNMGLQTTPDIGFKVFKLDSSNIRKWNSNTKDLEQSLLDQINNFVDGRTELDALYEIILKCGLELTVPVEELNIKDKKVYSVAYGALIVCLDNNITLDVANEIAKIDSEFVDKQNITVVFKDNGFANDSVKTNIKETMRAFGIGKFITV